MILGVPTLSRYDLLAKLIASAEEGTLKPSEYFIVDNGGRFAQEVGGTAAVAAAQARGAAIWLLTPGQNLGVAASWNAILNQALDQPVVISNDDIELGPTTLADLAAVLTDGVPFVIADGGWNKNGWCLFGQAASCTCKVGAYDENFYPAYYEDSDFNVRLKRAGIEPVFVKTSFSHEGWATMKAEPANGPVREGQRRSAEYFERKWGALPTEEGHFGEPFDGVPPWGWGLRMHSSHTWGLFQPRSTLKRWDIINALAERLGATRYLEIGVSGGESMTHVRVPEKWGVDPEPQVSGVKACTVFFPMTSDAFFSFNAKARLFQIVFIDGLHHAEQAYRDIQNAISALPETGGVIVVHDSNPSTEEMQLVPAVQSEWTGDVWKAVARVRAEGKHTVFTVDADYGVAMIVPHRTPSYPLWPGDVMQLTYQDLVQRREELLGLIPAEGWVASLRSALDADGDG
jgi:hypothetical protein